MAEPIHLQSIRSAPPEALQQLSAIKPMFNLWAAFIVRKFYVGGRDRKMMLVRSNCPGDHVSGRSIEYGLDDAEYRAYLLVELSITSLKLTSEQFGALRHLLFAVHWHGKDLADSWPAGEEWKLHREHLGRKPKNWLNLVYFLVDRRAKLAA